MPRTFPTLRATLRPLRSFRRRCSTLVPEGEGKKYFDYAETLLMNLSSDAYLAGKGTNGGFILMHSVGHLPADSEIDTPLNYADYYYLEAIGRYLSLRGLDPRRI